MGTPVRRKLGTIDYASGQRATLEIDRDGILAGLDIRLRFTVTAGSSAQVGPLFQTLARLIRRFEILVAGQDTIVSQSGEMLAARAQYEFGAPALGMDATYVLTGSSTATVYNVVIPVSFWLPRGRVPDDTSLDLRDGRIRQVVAAITWGSASDLVTTPNSAAVSAVTCELTGFYRLNQPDKTFPLVRVLDEVTQEVTATADSFRIRMDGGGQNLAYRSFMIASLDANVGEDDIINNVKLYAGSFTWDNLHPLQVKAENRRMFSQESLIAGAYMLFLPNYGEAADVIVASVLGSNLDLDLDVTKGTGTTNIKVSRETLRPLAIG